MKADRLAGHGPASPEQRGAHHSGKAEADALADLIRHGVHERNLNSLLSLLAAHVVSLLGADFSTVTLLDEHGVALLVGCDGVESDVWTKPGPNRPGGTTEQVLAAGHTIVFDDISDGGRYPGSRFPPSRTEGARTLLATPIPIRDGPRGVLHAAWRTPTSIGAQETDIAETLAALGGTIIDNARSHQEASKLAAWLKAIVDQMPSGVAVADAQGNTVLMNRAARKTISATNWPAVPADPRIGSVAWRDALRQTGIGTDPSAMRRALQGEVVEGLEYTLPGGLGGKIWVQASATPLLDEDGHRAGAVSVFANITDQKRTAQELTASRNRATALSKRLVHLQEQERRRIALELHDEIGPVLTGARLLLEAARRLPGPEKDAPIEDACRALDEAVLHVRDLSLDLRPPLLERLGLVPALEAYLERFSARTGVVVDFQAKGMQVSPSPEVERTAFRVLQEGLTNVAKHADVRLATVTLRSDERFLFVSLVDQGKGFDPAALSRQLGTGLSGMRERAELLGGEFTIESSVNGGARLLLQLPWAQSASRRQSDIRLQRHAVVLHGEGAETQVGVGSLLTKRAARKPGMRETQNLHIARGR